MSSLPSSEVHPLNYRYRYTYSVTVGNVGQVYLGFNRSIAEQTFEEYCSDSLAMRGRVAGEEVTLLCDGEPIREQVATCPHI